MLEINGIELELDIMDADVAEKYENAVRELQEKESNLGKSEKLSEMIRKQCKMVFDFFNAMWGEGTDKKVFGNKTNYNECEKAFVKVVEHVKNQQEEVNERILKYSGNRAMRRASK